jgi:hypothetical protein
MADQSVAAEPLSSNDISCLSEIFETVLRYYCSNTSPMEKDYLKEIHTLMGLGFAVVMVDGSFLPFCQPHLNTFLNYRDFKKYPNYLGVLSRAIAETTARAAYLFRFLGYPGYYEHFTLAVKKTVNHVMSPVEKKKRKD